MSSPTDLDLVAITKIANQLARREEFILEKQQWRDNEDRIRGFRTVEKARKQWIDTVIATQEKIEAAKKDHQTGQAKLDVLSSLVIGVQPANLQAIVNTQLRLEYIGEISTSTQALLDMVVSGEVAKIEQAVKAAEEARKVIAEIARARVSSAINSWVSVVNHGKGPNQAFKSVVTRVIEELFPDQMGKKLTLHQSALVQATAIERAGRSTILRGLVKGMKDTATIRAILISLTLLVVDTINSALDGGPTKAITTAIKGVAGIAAGTAVGILAEQFVANTVLAGAGVVTTAVLGTAAGALAAFVVAFVVGLIIDVLVDLLTSAFEVNEKKYWDAYLNTPIVYRVDIAV